MLNSMRRLTTVHILRQVAYTVPHFSRFWTVWTVRHFEECYEFLVGQVVRFASKSGAGDGDRTRNQRLGKPLLYH